MKNKKLLKIGLFTPLMILASANAQEIKHNKGIKADVTPHENKTELIEKLEKNTANQQLNKKKLSDNLPSEQLTKEEKIQQDLAYFKKHPEELEQLFLLLIRQKDVEKIKLLLPVYKQYPKKDMSLIDWGNALVYEDNNDYHQAVNVYRKMNSALPHLKTLRFYMANALFRDKQYEAAKSEFEKLRSEATAPADKEVINSYLDAIRESNTWTFDANLTYVNDKNLNNTAPKGTQLVLPGGKTLSVTAEPDEAKGFTYGLSVGKKFLLKNNYFTSLNTDINGTYYWNNHKYNDLSMGISTGFGYEDAKKEIEISPFFRNRLYAGVNEGSDDLSQYAKTFGVRLTGSYWLSPKWHYNGALSIGRDKYVKDYKHMNGNTVSLSNSLSYTPSQTRYFYAGIDISAKDTVYDDDTNKTAGIRAGWIEAWGKGFSTRLGFGVSKTAYKGIDWFGIKRKDTKFNVNASVWNRNIHLFGITPKLSYRYDKTSSNHKLHEYNKHNVFLEFSKTF